MHRFRVSLSMSVILLIAVACSSSSGRDSRSLSISEAENGNGIVVAMSEPLARAILEGAVGADLECGSSDLDDDFVALLVELDRGGRGSRAEIRDEDGVITARRSGRNLKLRFVDSDDGGRLEVKMPWAVAACLLDGTATLSARDADSIEVEIIGSQGGSFAFKVD